MEHLTIECPKHKGYLLTIVCKESACFNSRIICSQCVKIEHLDHLTMSIRQFINDHNKTRNLPNLENATKNVRQGLEYLKNQLLIIIKQCRNRCDDYFRKIQNNWVQCMDVAIKQICMDQEMIKRRMKEQFVFPSDFTNTNPEVESELNIQKTLQEQEPRAKKTAEKIVSQLTDMNKNLSNKLDDIVKATFRTMEDMKYQHKYGPATAQLIRKHIKLDNMCWSPTLCSTRLQVDEQKVRRREKGKSEDADFVLADCLLKVGQAKSFTWSIRIAGEFTRVYVGVCIEDQAIRQRYQGRTHLPKLGHGHFLFGNKGSTYNSFLEQENNQGFKNFSFGEGVVEICADLQNSCLILRRQGKELHHLKLPPTRSAQELLCPVVWIGQKDTCTCSIVQNRVG